ncbi:33 kDa ribonucleoprotein, chloroplastic [Linum grandiflorum]
MAALSMAACSSIASSPLNTTRASNLLLSTCNISTTATFRLKPFQLLLKPLTITNNHRLHQSRRYLAAAESDDFEVAAEDELLGDENDDLFVETDEEDEEEEANGGIPAGSSGAGRLYVGNLPYTVTSAELTEIFAEAGRVSNVELIYDRMTDRSRGFGFITMATVEEAKSAIKMFDESKVILVSVMCCALSHLCRVHIGKGTNGGRLQQVGGRSIRVNFPEVPKGGEKEMIGSRVISNYQEFIDSPHKVYAGNLSWRVTSATLKQVFAAQPGYLSAKVMYERDSGRSRGFGFVSFETAEAADAVLNSMNGLEVEGRPLRLNVAAPPKTPYSARSGSSGRFL